MATLLRHYRPVSTLAFCNTKQQCRDLVDLLQEQGFHALTLNGDMGSASATRYWSSSPTAAVRCWSRPTSPPAGSTSLQLEAVINVDVTPDPECYTIASAAPAAPTRMAGP